MTQKYDKEFKINAVKLYLSHDQSLYNIAVDLAVDLGVSQASLGKWVSSYKRDGNKSFLGSVHVVDEEMRALQRKLTNVRAERDILKKAVVIFSIPRVKGTNS